MEFWNISTISAMKMVVWPVITVLGLVLLVLVAVIDSDEEGHGEEGHGKEGHGYGHGHGHGHYKHREFSILCSSFLLCSPWHTCKCEDRNTSNLPLIVFLIPKLLIKLSSYDIKGSLYHWIAAFLSNRSQSVKINSNLSSLSLVASGVPQGSVLGPLVFNLFVNNVTDHLDPSVTAKLFADDIKLYTSFSNVFSHWESQRESQWSLAQDLDFWWGSWWGSWFLMRFLMRFLILNDFLAQDLIEILILEQSHWDS